MKEDLPIRRLGIGLAIALMLGMLIIPAVAQQTDQNLDLLPFPRQSATITLANTGLDITPAQLNPGPVTFTVVNNSDTARGVYITGNDRVGNPLLRYSMRIMPGASTTMEFWMYQGNNYTFHDFTSKKIVNDESSFTSNFSTQMSIATPFPIGRGPQYEPQTGTITITNTGIEVNPRTSRQGPITFNIINRSNHLSGVVISGEDRSGTPIIRYTRMIRPGMSANMSFWLYEGKDYTIRDFTRRYAVGSQMKFESRFRTTLTVSPGSPAFGAGPSMPDPQDQ
ncbi:MAG: hypothetical protein ABFD64_13015 [Armatimonadota bacterium]